MMTKTLPQLSIMLLCLYLLLFGAMKPAHAYIDPSLGSYALQIAIAAIVGTGFALKSVLLRVFGSLTRKKTLPEETGRHD